MVELLGESGGGPSNLKATLSLLSQYESTQDLATKPPGRAAHKHELEEVSILANIKSEDQRHGSLTKPETGTERQVVLGLCFVGMQIFSSKWGWCTTMQNSTVNLTAEEREGTTVGSS